MNRKRYRYYCFPSVLSATVAVLMVVSVIRADFVSPPSSSSSPHGTHQTLSLASTGTVIRQRPVARTKIRPDRNTTHSIAATVDNKNSSLAVTDTTTAANITATTTVADTNANTTDDTTANTDMNHSGVSNTTASEKAVITPSTVTEATIATVDDGDRRKTTDGYRCIKIRYTTPAPITKRWSPKIKKCQTYSPMNDTKKASQLPGNHTVSVTELEQRPSPDGSSTTAEMPEITADANTTDVKTVITINTTEITTVNLTEITETTTLTDIDTSPTSKSTDNDTTTETACVEDSSCNESEETPALTTVDHVSTPTFESTDNDMSTETTCVEDASSDESEETPVQTTADHDTTPTSESTDDDATTHTTSDEDTSSDESGETNALTTVDTEMTTVDKDSTEATTIIQSMGGKKNRKAQRSPSRRPLKAYRPATIFNLSGDIKQKLFGLVAVSASPKPLLPSPQKTVVVSSSSKYPVFSICPVCEDELMVPLREGADDMNGLRKSIIAEFL